MNCSAWRRELIELSRGGLSPEGRPAEGQPENVSDGRWPKAHLFRHTAVCPACRSFLEEQLSLSLAAAELMAADTAQPPANLESLLLGVFEARQPRRGRYLRATALAGTLAAALALLFAIAGRRDVLRPVARPPGAAPVAAFERLDHTVRTSPQPLVVPIRRHRPAAQAARSTGAPPAPASFAAIPYTMPLDPGEQAAVVRVDMPMTALAAVGLADGAPDPLASVPAEVIVSEDGRIRAVRLLTVLDAKENLNRRSSE